MVRPDERFTFLGCTWDVSAAWATLGTKPRATVEVAIAPLLGWLPVLRIDEEHADNVDLARPLILVRTPIGVMCIDGWHRIWRAERDQVARLPAYVLDEDEEKKVRLAGIIHRPRAD